MWENCGHCCKWINLERADYDVCSIEGELYYTHADVCTVRFLRENQATLEKIVRQQNGHGPFKSNPSFIRVDSRLGQYPFVDRTFANGGS